MKRVKTKHQNAGAKKQIRKATEETLGFYLPLCYLAMQDEFGLSLEECREWKIRLDRYAGHIAQGVVSFQWVKEELKRRGFNV